MVKRKKQSHCGLCGKEGFTSRTHCRICKTHCTRPNDPSAHPDHSVEDSKMSNNKKFSLPSDEKRMSSGKWLQCLAAENEWKILKPLVNGENLFHCIATAVASSQFIHIPSSTKELRWIVSNELLHPVIKGFNYEFDAPSATDSAMLAHPFAIKSKTLMEYREKIRKPFR